MSPGSKQITVIQPVLMQLAQSFQYLLVIAAVVRHGLPHLHVNKVPPVQEVTIQYDSWVKVVKVDFFLIKVATDVVEFYPIFLIQYFFHVESIVLVSDAKGAASNSLGIDMIDVVPVGQQALA